MSQDITATMMPNSSLCFNISMLTCCQTLLAKSGVAPNKVLFVDDSAKNIQSVRRVVRCCAFFATLIVALSHRISQSSVAIGWSVQNSFPSAWLYRWISSFTDGLVARPLGVCAVHLPEGLTEAAWSHSLEMYRAHQNTANELPAERAT